MLQLDGKTIAQFHVFFVAPLLTYVGWNKGRVPSVLFTVMLVLGLVAMGWHLRKLIQSGFANFGNSQLINLLHIILVGYLFACFGFRKGKVPDFVFTLMLIVVPFVVYFHHKKAMK
jgi:hypothetical protein